MFWLIALHETTFYVFNGVLKYFKTLFTTAICKALHDNFHPYFNDFLHSWFKPLVLFSQLSETIENSNAVVLNCWKSLIPNFPGWYFNAFNIAGCVTTLPPLGCSFPRFRKVAARYRTFAKLIPRELQAMAASDADV